MCSAQANFGKPPREVFVVGQQLCKEEWRRRHPKVNASLLRSYGLSFLLLFLIAAWKPKAPFTVTPATHPTPTWYGGTTSVDSTGSATTICASYSPQQGHTDIVQVYTAVANSGGPFSIYDNAGSSYSLAHSFQPTGDGETILYFKSAPGRILAGVTQTCVTYPNASKVVMIIGEYSGVAAFGGGLDVPVTTSNPAVTQTVIDNGDLLVAGIAANGTGTFSGGSGTLRKSAVTSGGSASSNVGGALVEARASSSFSSVTASANLSGSTTTAPMSLELKGMSPCTPGGLLVQCAVGARQSSDSNNLLWTEFSKNTTPGHLLVAAGHYRTAPDSTVVKDYTNTWYESNGPFSFGGQYAIVYYALNSLTTPRVIFAPDISTGTTTWYVSEYNVSSSAEFDAASSGSGTSTALDSGPASTSGTDEFLVGFGMSTNSGDVLTSGNGFSRRIQDSGVGYETFEDRSASGLGPYHGYATDNNSRQWGMLVTVFNLR
jgi:hypothetical protein